MKNRDNFTSFQELTTGELEAALMVENATIEAYKGNLSKSADFWKAIENKVKIESAMNRILAAE